jgi:hypothetical protein
MSDIDNYWGSSESNGIRNQFSILQITIAVRLFVARSYSIDFRCARI